MFIPQRVYERLQTRAHHEGECLISDYSVGSHGYAQIGWHEAGGKHVTLAHLAVWRFLYGEPPPGDTIDHTCKYRKCINPKHLRLIVNFENARRTNGTDWPMGQCKNGHDNKFLKRVNGDRKWACGICKSEWNRRYAQRRRDGLVGND